MQRQYGMVKASVWTQTRVATNLALQFTTIVTLSELLNIAKPQFLCESESDHHNLNKICSEQYTR